MRNKIIFFFYLIFVLLVSLYGLKKDSYNWDILGYMAVVIGYDHHDPVFVHDTVYQIAKDQLPASIYGQLVDGGIEFRRRVAASSNEFDQQLPFYSVKPLYTRMVYLFYKLGIPLIASIHLPSLFSFFLMGFLLLFWIKKYIQFFLALSVSLLIILSAPMLEVDRISTPDCLSAFLLFSAMYFIFEAKSLMLTFIFLLLSIFARLDNIIPSIFILTLLTFSREWGPDISVKKYILILLCFSLSFLSISHMTIRWGWSILYYPTFMRSLNLSYAFHPQFHFGDYMSLAISHFMTGLFFTNLLLYLSLSLLVFIVRPDPQSRRLGFDQLFLCVIFLIITVRFVLQPMIADRIYIAYYLCILILLIRSQVRQVKWLSS
jgi:hypothetical protein